MVTLPCPSCGATIGVPPELVGRPTPCPNCRAPLRPTRPASNSRGLLIALAVAGVLLASCSCAGLIGAAAVFRYRATVKSQEDFELVVIGDPPPEPPVGDLPREDVEQPDNRPPTPRPGEPPDRFALRDDLGSRDAGRRLTALRQLAAMEPYADAQERQDIAFVVSGYVREPALRDAALAVLVTWADEKTAAALAEGLKTSDPALRDRCLAALLRLKSPAAAPLLVKAMETPAERGKARDRLAELGEAAEPALIEYARRPANRRDVRLECVKLLGRVGRTPAAEQALAALAKAPDRLLAKEAQAALAEVRKRR